MSAVAVPAAAVDVLEPEDVARARWYSFFSRWFLAPPDQKALDLFLGGQGGSAPEAEAPDTNTPDTNAPDADAPDQDPTLGAAWEAFADAAARDGLPRLRAAYDDTFISIGEAPVSLHACVYLTGFSNERPLADIRQWLAAQGIEGAQGGLQTEDHLGLLCEAMTWLIIGDDEAGGRGAAAQTAGDAAQHHLFSRFIEPACDGFCRRLADAPDAGAYRDLGRLFAAFVAVERQAFDIEL